MRSFIGPKVCRVIMLEKPMTALSGVSSSWLICVRKSNLLGLRIGLLFGLRLIPEYTPRFSILTLRSVASILSRWFEDVKNTFGYAQLGRSWHRQFVRARFVYARRIREPDYSRRRSDRGPGLAAQAPIAVASLRRKTTHKTQPRPKRFSTIHRKM